MYFFQELDMSDKQKLSSILFIISMYCKTIWIKRNLKKFERKTVTSNSLYLYFLSQLKIRILADFERFPSLKFMQYWCINDLFCKIGNGKLNITFY